MVRQPVEEEQRVASRSGSPKRPGSPQRPRSAAAERSARLQAEARRKEKRDSLLGRGVLVAAVLVAVGILGAAVLVSRGDESAATPTAVTESGGVLLGSSAQPADAPVQVTVYEDFLCPFCARFEEEAGEQLTEYAASDPDVAVEYVAVNFLDRLSPDSYSTRSANASLCVFEEAPDAWNAFHAALFANQPSENGPGLDDDRLLELAGDAGADADALRPCVEDQRFAGTVDEARDAATESDVQGTPTVRVNGEDIATPSLEALQAAVEAARA